MDIEQYIASGILETYVLGELPEDERREVEQMAGQYPEVHQEIGRIEETLKALAFKAAIVPSPNVKDQLMQRIEGTADAQREEKVTPIMREAKASWMKYALAACVALLLFTTFTTLYFWNQWQDAEQQVDQLVAQNQVIAEERTQVTSQYEEALQSLRIVNDTAFTKVNMQGLDISPNAYAVVFWNNNSEDVYLNPIGLPAPATDKQYQLWAIVNGQPVSAGVFDIQEGIDLIKMQNIQGASAFAITLEPQGGSESPTLEAMYVMGNV